jgi:dienelactone hydrolase
MGHSGDGKGSGLYQRCCQGLVQLGYVVLAFDPTGQGERTNYPRAGGWQTRLRSVDDEHTVPGKQMLLTGETMSGLQLWDAMRSLDVLASHPQVDAKRIGSTGQSGGATVTMLLAGADDRLAAAAVSSGNTENFAVTPFLSPGSVDDAEQDFVGSAPLAFDRWDLLWPMAPKPLLVSISARDYFGTYSPSYEKSGREDYAKLARAYAALGAPGHLTWFETPLPHGLSYSMRVAIYNCFERGLKHSERKIDEEPPTAPEKEETLWCGPTANHVRDFKGKTPFVLTRERAAAIRTPETPAGLHALLGMDPGGAAPRLEVRGRTRYSDCDIQAVEVNSAPQVWAPAWLFLPKRPWTKLLLLVEPNGRNGRWHEDDLYPQLAAAGVAVCAQDVRGVGDLEAQFSPGSAAHERGTHNEDDYAISCLILGRSLLGQRAQDIASMAAALAGAYPQATIVTAARDKMTVPALCAASLEKRIAKVYLSNHLASWRSLLAAEDYTHTFANFVPNVLSVMDLPFIARSLAPREVIVAGAVDGAGRTVADAASLYPGFREKAAWDLATLSAL